MIFFEKCMDENITSHDVAQHELQDTTPTPIQPEEHNLLKAWDSFWERITQIGLEDLALRVGTGLLSLVMIVMVIWVMSNFFLKGERISAETEQTPLAEGAEDLSSLELPSYEGVAPVEGISRQLDMHTYKPTTSRFEIQDYEVQAGDTVFGIAEKFNLKPETILWGNYEILLDNPAKLTTGQVLDILPVDGLVYKWNEGDGLNGVSDFFGVAAEDIMEWPGNQLNPETIGDYADPNIEPGTWIFIPGGTREFVNWSAPRIRRDNPAVARVLGPGHCEPVTSGPIGTGVFVWPTSETYISGWDFSPAINHWAIDIGGKSGNPIFAADNGVVVYAGENHWGYGIMVVIDHGNGWQTLYAHLLSELNVECGSSVHSQGVIGWMGSTGNSSGPHLHFEMMLNGQRVNPHKYLPY